MQYHEEIESSSDEENDQVSHFVHPGFFMLDGNNNLEDDSSMSEDLDVEWRYGILFTIEIKFSTLATSGSQNQITLTYVCFLLFGCPTAGRVVG